VSSGSMDEYFAKIDYELAQQEEARRRHEQLLRPLPKLHVRSMPMSPDLPPDIVEYFKRSQKNDELLAAVIEQMEQEKINKDFANTENPEFDSTEAVEYKEEVTTKLVIKNNKLKQRSRTLTKTDSNSVKKPQLRNNKKSWTRSAEKAN